MMAMQVARIGLEHIPPVTLGAFGLNVALFYFDVGLGDVRDVCVGAGEVYWGGQYRRLALAAVFHLSEMHLAYNMASLLWKGRQLEHMYGPRRFAFMLVLFALLSNALLTAAGVGMLVLGDNPYGMRQCAAGFSGVLFAMKTVLFQRDPDGHERVRYLPFVISRRYAVWVELALIQMLVPNASFLGHLCGIAVGYAFGSGHLDGLLALADHLPDPAQFGGGGGGGDGGGGGGGGRGGNPEAEWVRRRRPAREERRQGFDEYQPYAAHRRPRDEPAPAPPGGPGALEPEPLVPVPDAAPDEQPDDGLLPHQRAWQQRAEAMARRRRANPGGAVYRGPPRDD